MQQQAAHSFTVCQFKRCSLALRTDCSECPLALYVFFDPMSGSQLTCSVHFGDSALVCASTPPRGTII